MKDSRFLDAIDQSRVIGRQLGTTMRTFIDRFIPGVQSNADPETIWRSRLLVPTSFGLASVALFFLALTYHLKGQMTPGAWLLFSCTVFFSLNPFLLRWTGSHLLPGLLLSLELLAHFAAMAYYNGGHDAAVLVWIPLIPLSAILFVGSSLGLVCTVLAAGEALGFFLLSHQGYPFPRALSQDQLAFLKGASSFSLTLVIGFIGWLYERLRKNALERENKARLALRHSERYFRMLIENTSDLISILDNHGVLRYVNPAHEQELGYQSEELIGQNAFTLIHPEDSPRLSHSFALARPIPGEIPRFEFRIRARDGTWRVLEATADNLLHDPAVQGVIVSSRDITKRKQVERLKDELVSTVSHELRTPLTSLRGFTELMLRKEFPRDKQCEFLSIIQNESLRLTNLINDFLDLQTLESGRQARTFVPTHIDTLMREVAKTFIPDTGRHALQTDFPSGLPLVRIDVERLRQVFSNLIANAVKYSPNGGPITIGARQADGELIAWVADEGLGIPEDALPHLFTKFFRVDNQDTRSIGGTGLGLSLVKNIIELHGGRVWVESKLGHGSSFFFSLPSVSETSHHVQL